MLERVRRRWILTIYASCRRRTRGCQIASCHPSYSAERVNEMSSRLTALQCNPQSDNPQPSEKRDTTDSMIHINREPKRVKLGIDKSNPQNGQTKSRRIESDVTHSMLERLHEQGTIRHIALLYSEENSVHTRQYWRVRQFRLLKMNHGARFVPHNHQKPYCR